MSWSGWWRTIRSFADVSKTLPTNEQVLKWNATTLQYEPSSSFAQIANIKNLQTPTPATDGSTVLFTAPDAYVSGSLRVIRDQASLTDDDFTETDPDAGTFTLDEAPDADEVLRVSYLKQ
jgi:hypothetical protein